MSPTNPNSSLETICIQAILASGVLYLLLGVSGVERRGVSNL